MTPMQAIVASTKTSAQLLHLDRFGTLDRGKRADFIILDANPLEQIDNTKKIASVYQRGTRVDRTVMRSTWSR
jgi:imidazolonepropionase-like amidohydrolase